MFHYLNTNVNKIDLIDGTLEQIAVRLTMFDKKATTCYFGLVINVCL
jgi:hypothetical protein